MLYKDDTIFSLVEKERKRQESTITLIASENFVSAQVAAIAGSVLTNKYAEGYPSRRYYGGCEVVDQIETLAIERAKTLFNVDWVNVQPHSGSQANAAVMLSLLKPYDKILGFHIAHGGHLTHGSAVNFSGKLYQAAFYGVNRDSGYIEWEEVAKQARIEKPKVIICGASAYSRDWDYATLRMIADEVGAFLWADIAHTAGFISQGLLNNPFPYCHFVTTTTHKTLRGPRGGMILMGKDFDNPFGRVDAQSMPLKMSALLNSAVFPGTQGGPLMHIIAAKAVAFYEAMTSKYKDYIGQVQKNAKIMAEAFIQKGYKVISNGTDNHLFLLDLSPKHITGAQAEQALQKADIITNRNMIPFDTQSPFVTSGLRLGLSAITTRGFVEKDVLVIVEWIDQVLMNMDREVIIRQVKKEVNSYIKDFPLSTMDD